MTAPATSKETPASMFAGKLLPCKACGAQHALHADCSGWSIERASILPEGRLVCWGSQSILHSPWFDHPYQAINAWNEANAPDELKQAWAKHNIRRTP